MDIDRFEQPAQKLTYAALFLICLTTFVSFSVSAGHHIFLLFPGLFFLYQNIKKNKYAFSMSSWSLLLLFIICVISVLPNWGIIDRPLKNMFKAKYFFFAFLAYIGYRELVTKSYFTVKRIRLLIHTFMISTSIATISGLIALETQYHPLRMKAACHYRRACGMYGMYMTYGYGIAFFVIIALGLYLQRKKLARYFNKNIVLLAFLVNVVGLYYSLARGAWLAFLVALPTYFLFKNKKVFFAIIITSLIAAPIAYMTVPKIKHTFSDRSRLKSNKVRIQQFQAAYQAFKDKPILGYGYRNFEPNSLKIKEKHGFLDPAIENFQGHAHNNFLEHLASTGVLGFLALLFFHLFWLIEMYKRNDAIGTIVFPFILALGLSGQFQYTFGDGENLFLILNVWALSQVIPRIKDEQYAI